MALEGSSIMMRILYTGVKKILKKQKKMKKKKKYFENLVKEVKVVAVDFERAIIIADIGGKDVYSTEFRTINVRRWNPDCYWIQNEIRSFK